MPDGSKPHMRRVAHELRVLSGRPSSLFITRASASLPKLPTVSIGGVQLDIHPPERRELVPFGVARGQDSQEELEALRWMLQKEKLGQDMFLIGRPGPARRRLAMRFCEVAGREFDYIAFTRDTSESDFKQRREIRNGSAQYVDQCAVEAALHGRVLILDGIEKAERNVLPLLNNLLENREMALEDGRFMMAPARFDELNSGAEVAPELAELQLVRVHPRFRVIALGVPVPQFPGHPLDPPLRSRFQARDIPPPTVGQEMAAAQSADRELVSRLAGFASTLRLLEEGSRSHGSALPSLPDAACAELSHRAALFPGCDLRAALERVFPCSLMSMDTTHMETVDGAWQRFQLHQHESTSYQLHSVQLGEQGALSFSRDSGELLTVPGSVGELGAAQIEASTQSVRIVETDSMMHTVSAMAMDHCAGADLCLVGPPGSGKSTAARLFALKLGYAIETVPLFQDMSARELVQRRVTTQTGDTVWEHTQLVLAALGGRVAILDGIDRLAASTLNIVQRLVQDRELTLFDGTKLINQTRFQQLLTEGMTSEQLAAKGVLPVHPDFRLIAIANPPDTSSPWLSAEVAGMFSFHLTPELSTEQQCALLLQMVPTAPQPTVQALCNLAQELKEQDTGSLSFRQLLRLSLRAAFQPEDLAGMRTSLHDSAMMPFLPLQSQQAFSMLLTSAGFPESSKLPSDTALPITKSESMLSIGDVSVPILAPSNPALVPSVLFFDVPMHTELLRRMLVDFSLGEHLLLIGNQGVGKNKLCDRLLELLGRERHYVQLHRDTTIQSLTLTPSLQDGVMVWQDSPLIKAASRGHVLVIDEADKAPLEVVCVLKGLLEDGEMLLSDGRRILGPKAIAVPAEGDISVQEGFQLVVLANRPGFPFLGNDFYREIGDVFSAVCVDNLDQHSEIRLLQSYAPSVSRELLGRLTALFGDLRASVSEGLLSYPYSTRELVSIAKHLHSFPEDPLSAALDNVFAYENYDAGLKKQMIEAFQRHGIPISLTDDSFSVKLAPEDPLPILEPCTAWSPLGPPQQAPRTTAALSYRSDPIQLPGAMPGTGTRLEGCIRQFSEELFRWRLSPQGGAHPLSVASTTDGALHVLYGPAPLELISFAGPDHRVCSTTDLSGLFPFFALQQHPPSLDSWAQGLLLTVPGMNLVLQIDTTTRQATPVDIPVLSGEQNTLPVVGGAPNKFLRAGGYRVHSREPKLCLEASLAIEHSRVLCHQLAGDKLAVLELAQGSSSVFSLPPGFALGSVTPVGPDVWLLGSPQRDQVLCASLAAGELQLRPLGPQEGALWPVGSGALAAADPLLLAEMLELAPEAAVHLAAHPEGSSLAEVLVGLPCSPEQAAAPHWSASSYCVPLEGREAMPAVPSPQLEPESGALSVPVHEAVNVVDFGQQSLKRVPLGQGETRSTAQSMCRVQGEQPGRVAVLSAQNELVVLDTDSGSLDARLLEWQRMIHGSGQASDGPLSIEYDGKKEASMPKHGKVDDKEHHGGNTWAGGTGGADTAGLGGKGGPYRLDKGNPVYQISEAEKKKVSEESRAAARQMAKEELAKRLAEIDMSEHQAGVYESLRSGVGREISQLRVVLQSVEAKKSERKWLRNQLSGDLDDRKLVDGVVGDKNVYMRRGEEDHTAGMHQEKPKRLVFVMDVSGSMYRFNSQDGRLDRLMQTSVMLMESLAGFEHKYEYSIVGHSGDGPAIQFVPFGEPPKNDKERLQVCHKMHAHTQYCMSGDTTVEAAELAVRSIVQQEADDYFVFLVSDANLRRYGIQPKELASVLTKDPKVHAAAFFIASLGDEAVRLAKEMPLGLAHVCLDPARLPPTLKQIFTASMFKDLK